jgi:hypothetical protein
VAVTYPGEEVSADAARLPIHEIVAYLQKHLGQRTTAYVSGVRDPKMVSHWIARRNMPRDQAQMRLREAYQATRLLEATYGDETARAWFSASNARLGDQAPAFVIRSASQWEDLRLVVPVARAFVASAAAR